MLIFDPSLWIGRFIIYRLSSRTQSHRFLVCACHGYPVIFVKIHLNDLDLADRHDKIDAGLALIMLDCNEESDLKNPLLQNHRR